MGFEALREQELPFFKLNQIATPVRITSFQSTGGKAQPKIEKNYLEDTGVGKSVAQRDPALNAYSDNSYNLQ